MNGHIEREADIEKCVRQGVTTSGPDTLAPPHDHLIYTQKELDLNVDILGARCDLYCRLHFLPVRMSFTLEWLFFLLIGINFISIPHGRFQC